MKDPEKYQFKPKELLAQICSIYLNFANADRDGVFARAVAADGRSYREAMFSEASLVLRQFGLMQEGQLAALEALAARVAEAAAAGEAAPASHTRRTTQAKCQELIATHFLLLWLRRGCSSSFHH